MNPVPLLAPFGHISDYDHLISINPEETFLSEYHFWEELIARKCFKAHGFQVDRIAASMHHYVETAKNPKVESVQYIHASFHRLMDLSF